MKSIVRSFVLLISVSFSCTVLAKPAAYTTQNPAYELDGKAVFGRLENVYFTGKEEYKQIAFDAKIDTGADTTSIHADNIHITSNNPKFAELTDSQLLKTIIEEFGGVKSDWWLTSFDTPERDLQVFVQFTARNPHTGDVLEFKRPLHRVSVVRSRTSKEPLYRPVILVKMRIGDVDIQTEASLTDRGSFSAPILIGKSFLRDQAWVFAGYDFLQAQRNTQLIGRSEVMEVNGLAMDTSLSLSSKYSSMHATNIKLDDKKQQVSFETEDNQGNSQAWTLPLIDTIKLSGKERPEVYVPVKGGDHFSENILVYLTDRSNYSSQLRLGKNTLSRYFTISAQDKNLLAKPAVSYSDFISQKKPIIVSPEEQLSLDGIPMLAVPDLRIKTPVLQVSSFEISSADKGEHVTYFLADQRGGLTKFVKPIVRKIRVGESVRPIVEVRLEANGRYKDYQIALEAHETEQATQPRLLMGQNMTASGLIINTRTEGLLQSHELIEAGYIEQVTVEGLSFPAKLDTGADVSSINAHEIELYKKDGVDMVDFVYNNKQGQSQKFTLPVARMMTIKAKAGEKANHRPVVLMDVQVGNIRETVEVNLQDRARFDYSMILGENFLRYGVVVSSDQQFIIGKGVE